MSRPTWTQYGLSLARAVAARADCTRRTVGAVIMDAEHRVVSTGYNGSPPGGPSCTAGQCPRGRLTLDEHPSDSVYTDCIAIHAEANAILWARRDLRGTTLFITHPPCHECRRLIAAVGITNVITPPAAGE